MLRRLLFLGLVTASVSIAVAGERTGDRLVNQIKSLKRPPYDQAKAKDPKWLNAYMLKVKAYGKQRNDLILQLYKTDPSHPRTLELMETRWQSLEMGNLGDGEAYRKRVAADVDKILAGTKNPKMHALGQSVKVQMQAQNMAMRGENPMPLIEAYLGEFPKSKYGEQLLIGTSYSVPAEKRVPYYERYLAEYPKSSFAPMIRGALRQREGVGKPFVLSFFDAITGKKFDMADMQGKVVLVDFWATWCGPCVAKMPELKEVAKEFGPQGLQVIGVSLDQSEKDGGLKALKEFVAKNQVPWPQYYQGKGWESQFSSDWGIMSIPTVFLVDKKGNLRAIEVSDLRGQVRKLLAE